MELNKIYHGSCLDLIKNIPNNSVNSVITSPPYWQLRDYGWDGQWGLEPTYQMYLENLWSLMDEIHRILKDEGTVWVNLGDTYHNPTKWTNKDSSQTIANGNNRNFIGTKKQNNGIPSKCLILIPHRFAIGCIDRGWVLRNDIVWAKRNGMPESVTDRFSKKHEYFFLMAKKDGYYFDLESVRLTPKQVTIDRMKRGISENNKWVDGANGQSPHSLSKGRINAKYSNGGRLGWTGEKSTEGNINGANPGSVSDFWDIPTKGSSDNHFAAYNTKLIDKPIMAGCPEGGIILDPFCGTATTGCRAIELGRKFIGFEGSKEYVDIGNKKLYPYTITQQLF